MSEYGVCPKCGDEGVSRERRLNGNDRCVNGHSYPSSTAVMSEMDRQEELEAMSDGRLALQVSILQGRGGNIWDDKCYRDELETMPSLDPMAVNDISKLITPVEEFDPCNNPGDIMPIALEHRIYFKDYWGGGYTAYELKSRVDGKICSDENPYRAICIVFILMSEEMK